MKRTDKLDFSGLTTVASMADLDISETSETSAAGHYFDGVNNVTLDLAATEPFVLE